MIKKFQQYNESIRDKMTPKSEEEILNNLSEEDYNKYKIIKKLMDKLDETPLKLTFVPKSIRLEVSIAWYYFTIFFNDDGDLLLSIYDDFDGVFITEDKKFEDIDKLFYTIIEYSIEGINFYKKEQQQQFDRIKKDLIEYDDDLEKLKEIKNDN